MTKTLNILGYPYTVISDILLQDMSGNIGYCNFDKQWIQVAKDVANEARNSTLLHEVMEALNYHLEIGLSEAQIKQLEVGLHQVMSDSGISLDPLFK